MIKCLKHQLAQVLNKCYKYTYYLLQPSTAELMRQQKQFQKKEAPVTMNYGFTKRATAEFSEIYINKTVIWINPAILL